MSKEKMTDAEKRVRALYGTLNERGQLIPDPVPFAPSVKINQKPSLAQQIKEMVRSERLAMEAENMGYETFEEAEDFDVGDDFDPASPYENDFDPSTDRDWETSP